MSSRGSSRGNDDWVCSDSQCGNLNFARRLYCNRCGRDKDSLPSKRPSTEIGKAAAERSRGLFSADDWQCAKCGNVNWARRVQCNVCNAPRVGDVEERTGYGGGYNERENVEYIDREESDGEYDEFGRKKKKYRDPALMPKPKIKEPEANVVEEEDEEEDEDGDLSKYKLESDEEDEDGDISKYDLGSSDEDLPKNDKRPHLSSHSSRSSKKSSSSSRSRSHSDSPPAKKKRLSSGHSRSRSRSSSQDSRSPARKLSQSGSSKSNRSGSGSPDSSSNKSRERSGSNSRSRPRH